ncbi:MAG: bifunctional diguanylate cyclase/phosphodiesterase [Pseudomonadota bacterium]
MAFAVLQVFDAPIGRLHAALQTGTLNDLRAMMCFPILVYYWICAAIVLICALLLSVPLLPLVMPLMIIGLLTSYTVQRRPGRLQTRLTLTIAINATWMFGLFVAAQYLGGAFMVEVHMFYFINTAVILAFACWRSVVLTTAAALLHHLVFSMLQPGLVWPGGNYPWIHLFNHAVLGVLNCFGGCLIAVSLKSVITRSQTDAANMRQISINEPLTNLLNRRGFFGGLEQLYRTGHDTARLAIIAIDLDGFKQINDTAGHAVGDQLLQKVAQRLVELAPEHSIVARMGGDEFVLALPGWDKAQALALVEPFLEWTRQPCTIDGREVRFGASIGVALGSGAPGDVDALLVDADIALYAAKNHNKNCVKFFNTEMRAETLSAKALEDDVRRGLEAGEFVPAYQTQHNAQTGRLAGVEALARWQHPERGMLGPDAFMPVIDAMGRMADLDNAILQRACADVRRLEQAGFDIRELSVNVSFSRLHDPNLKAEIDALPAMRARLVFEIVETVILDEMSTEQNMMLDAMREKGIGVAIDDFGTGHASIVALTQILPDKLKIDRQMIVSVTECEMNRSVLQSVLTMVNGLNIETVAEGVEFEEEAALLAAMGVDQLQGFLFSRPMPFDAFADYLATCRSSTSAAPQS